MTILYEPTTDNGKGFLPLLIRALTHVAAVMSAHVHGYPMTIEEARAELDEAMEHAREIEGLNFLSAAGLDDLHSWIKTVSDVRDNLRANEGADPEQNIEHYATAMVPLMQQSWALGQSLDIELLGLHGSTETDAGRFA